MLFKAPGQPTKLKKIIYVSVFMVLGILLSFIIHALIEINIINYTITHSQMITFYGSCVLTPQLQISLGLIGLIFGFISGLFWWQKIYVERVWLKYQKKSD